MDNTNQIIDNHNKSIQSASMPTDKTTATTTINSNKTFNCRQKNTCPFDGNCLQSSSPNHRDMKRQQRDRNVHPQKTTSKLDTETTPHQSAMPNTETPPNSESTSGPSKTATSNTLFPGTSCHLTRRTTAQAKDVISASKKNS